ncbi:hypothetical protein [Rhodanobacter umsongensis]
MTVDVRGLGQTNLVLQAQRQQQQPVFVMRLLAQLCAAQAFRLERVAGRHRGDDLLGGFWGHGIKKGRVIDSRGPQG